MSRLILAKLRTRPVRPCSIHKWMGNLSRRPTYARRMARPRSPASDNAGVLGKRRGRATLRRAYREAIDLVKFIDAHGGKLAPFRSYKSSRRNHPLQTQGDQRQ